jgi:hypothetical protein
LLCFFHTFLLLVAKGRKKKNDTLPYLINTNILPATVFAPRPKIGRTIGLLFFSYLCWQIGNNISDEFVAKLKVL